MRSDYADDPALSDHLEESRSNLFDYFNENYANADSTDTSAPLSIPSTPVQPAPTAPGSPQKSFMARYRRKDRTSINELEEYFKLPPENFDACEPIRWWFGRRGQFPNLFCMARDILCIPGKYSVSYWWQCFLMYVQVLLSLLKGYFQVVATQFPSGVRASLLTLYAFLCLLRSDYILRVSKPMLLCVVEYSRQPILQCT